jgi:hypothetical protein
MNGEPFEKRRNYTRENAAWWRFHPITKDRLRSGSKGPRSCDRCHGLAVVAAQELAHVSQVGGDLFEPTIEFGRRSTTNGRQVGSSGLKPMLFGDQAAHTGEDLAVFHGGLLQTSANLAAGWILSATIC